MAEAVIPVADKEFYRVQVVNRLQKSTEGEQEMIIIVDLKHTRMHTTHTPGGHRQECTVSNPEYEYEL